MTEQASEWFRLSEQQHERRQKSLAGGVATAFRASQRPVPITFVRGEGSKLIDIDGHEYVDWALGFGPMLLGHSPQPVLSAVRRQLDLGLGYGASHPLEGELAEAICETVPSAELCVFNTTGSEAVHSALRIARAATGRKLIIKFSNHYNGWYDPVHTAVPGQEREGPATGGQDPDALRSTLVCRWNDVAALERKLNSDVAAVIMEPIAVNGGCILPAPGYLEAAQKAARRAGAVLIFDEVITGYRAALGGAQERLGVTPDLTVLGKAIGGGLPISAVVGRADIMKVVSTRVNHVGTFNLNPLAAAAALATVRHLQANAKEIYAHLEAMGAGLASALREGSKEGGLPVEVNQIGAMAHASVAEPANENGYREVAAGLLRAGVHVIPRGTLYASTVHSDKDVETTRSAVVTATRLASQPVFW
jgi:glutamate-1-semialdehyde 2,1-aminomutase